MSENVKDFLEELKEYSNGGIPGLYPPEDTVKELLDYIEQLHKYCCKRNNCSVRLKENKILEKE